MWRRTIGGALVTAVLTLANPGGVAAQAADVAGSWNLAVDVNGTVTNPTMTLTQSGEAIAGHYSSTTLGEADFEGTVTGSQVAFSFDATVDAQGQTVPLTVTYSLTLNGDGTLTGTIDLGGLASGAVRGTRG